MRPPTPSPLARREALRRQLALALAQRDPRAVLRLSTQWVHRQGVAALEPLMLELVATGSPTLAPDAAAAAELLQWWRQLLREPVAAVVDAGQDSRAASPAPESAAVVVPIVRASPSPIPSIAPSPLSPPAASDIQAADRPAPAARVLPFPQPSARRRPAPAPAHPGLASLRAWLATPPDIADADPSAAALTPEELGRAA